jgi:transcriptional regulator with XRE-family HTH domain
MVTERTDHPVGRYIVAVREAAGMTQAQLAQRVTFSSATVSRIESGERPGTAEELEAILQAIGTLASSELKEYLSQDWDHIPSPSFDHPSRQALWQANLLLRRLDELKGDEGLSGIFLRQADLYASSIRSNADFLLNREHQVAFIGSIAVGKSTAICKVLGLMRPSEDRFSRQMVLEAGAGGTTLCEVHVSQGPGYGIRIVPRSEDAIRQDVEDFAEYLIGATQTNAATVSQAEEDDEDPLGISKETVRTIRNLAGLAEKRRVENGKRISIDPAKELARQFTSPHELAIDILTKMDLLRRTRRDAWYPDDHPNPPLHWLQQNFSDINNGRHPEFTMPDRIEVLMPGPVLESRDLPLRVIDTKGIDQTAERQDLESHFYDPRTLVVLCSRFQSAPEVPLQSLLRRAKEGGSRDLAARTILLALPRPGEAVEVKYDDGMEVEEAAEGYELKRDQIELRLGGQGQADIEIAFFNASEDPAGNLRDQLLNKLHTLREAYSEDITRLAGLVDDLIENRGSNQIRLVFERVSSDLRTWTLRNREVTFNPDGVQQSLINAINETRYASRIRASVRRAGNWDSLDYYYHLSYGVRAMAVAQIGAKLAAFRTITENLMANQDLALAGEFLGRILKRVETAADEAYRRLQDTGRFVFKQALEADWEFWQRCEARWGQGPGYRTAIRDLTSDEVEQSAAEIRRIEQLVTQEWQSIVSLLDQLLQEGQATPAPASP